MSETTTRVKICGITNSEDARAAIEYGADALGFIFVPNTPRYIGSNSVLLNAISSLPPFLTRVAVCQNPDDLTDEQVEPFTAIQFYEQPCDRTRHLRRPQVMACRIKDAESLSEIATVVDQVKPVALLLDTYHKDKLGGSGETFNWDLAIEVKQRFGLPIILAGGLTPENVGAAIEKVRPYAVDVASGVEAEPGRKDHARLKAFLRAVRSCDNARE